LRPAPAVPAGLQSPTSSASPPPQSNSPTIAVSRDDKGVYTLKPAEPATPASLPPVERIAPPASSQSGGDN
jgi:hypothetical protein